MSADKSINKQVIVPNPIKFLFGGLSGMAATCVVQPLDLIKNRMQLSEAAKGEQRTSLSVIKSVLRNEGISGLYAGLSAGLLRQASYTTVRMGVYNTLLEYATNGNTAGQSTAPSFAVKAGVGMCAGAIGAFCGSPAEISLIRMTADGRLPVEERRNYKHVLDALTRISREEGVKTLWRGCAPTIGRAMVVNAAQLASYSQAKQILISNCNFNEGIGLHFCASMISGLCTTIASMPLDIAKTRIQNMKVIDGRPEYKGSLDVIVKLVRSQGPFSLWKGFTPYYARLGPHTVLTFIVLEQLNAAYIRLASN